jgi:N-acetylglutamate synthase-like GNAT family acetyltransferase
MVENEKPVIVRAATATDEPVIRAIVNQAGINPLGLTWPRFLVAEAQEKIIGIGQIKPHADGSRELASIAVIPAWQGQGIARTVIQRLLAQESGPLYLMCRPSLEPFYARFGFLRIEPETMPPYFRRLSRLVNLAARLLGGRTAGVIVMKRAAP